MSKLALERILENIEQRKNGQPATRLNLGGCGLTEIPRKIAELVWLEELVLGEKFEEEDDEIDNYFSFIYNYSSSPNNIKSLPYSLTHLVNLKKLYIGGVGKLHGSIENLHIISQLSQLKTLGFFNIKIKDLHFLHNLTQLETLYLSGPSIKDISPVSKLTQLEILKFSNTKVVDLTPISQLQHLIQLECSSTNIVNLTPISQLRQLKQINCSNTGVSDLSPVSQLTSLLTLQCVNTNINDLSPVSQLNSLLVLEFTNTKIKDLNPISKLKQLQILDCSSSLVTDLRPILNLWNLTNLSCSNTSVNDLNPINNLTQLMRLDCSNTPVNDLKPVKNLTQLNHLNCSNTSVDDLTPIIHLLKNGLSVKFSELAGDIQIANCPITSPPLEIAYQGNEAIITWFESQKQGSKPLNEAKLLILGEGGVGKTTLAEKIMHGFGRPLPSDSTHGIEIMTHTFQCHNEQEFKANIWDFGGQEIYHSTHQFFLTKRSLYILVDDARKEDTRFDYWLQIVELLSERSPVIIVQNCKAGRQRDLDQTGLKAQFGNVKDVFYLDLSQDSTGFDELLRRIHLELQAMPHTNELWISNWIAARITCEQLRQTGKKRISYEHFEVICAEHNIQLDEIRVLGRYLHDLGVVLYFHDDPLLRRTVFLDNQWMVNGVYEVLDDTKIKEKQGRFHRQNAADIWEKSDYRDLHDELLQLMMKFELCYPIPDTVDQYLVPHLLPASTPELEWDEKNSLQLHYRYKFMPKGLISRLIVRLHRFVKNTEQAWRTGVVFEREGARMRVVETYGEKYLRLHCIGKQSRDLITIVSDEIDRLNGSYQGLKVEKLVPCNCNACQHITTTPHFYDYADLMRRQERGKRTVECNNSYNDVDVFGLLDHVFLTTSFTPKKPKIFISYSEADIQHLEAFKKHLNVLKSQEEILMWDKSDLVIGEHRDNQIKQQLAIADIIILLVSSDFMATDYIREEINIAIEQHHRAEAFVIPVIVRPCDWESTPFSKFSALPEKGKPVVTWNQEDEAWASITRKIREVVRQINKKRNPRSSFN